MKQCYKSKLYSLIKKQQFDLEEFKKNVLFFNKQHFTRATVDWLTTQSHKQISITFNQNKLSLTSFCASFKILSFSQ